MLIYKGYVEYVINVENLKHLLTNMCRQINHHPIYIQF